MTVTEGKPAKLLPTVWIMRHFRFTADDREAFSDRFAAMRERERLADLRRVLDQMEVLMGRAISDGQRLIEEASYSGADFGGLGPGPEMKRFREQIEAAFEDALGTVRISISDMEDELEAAE